MAAKHLIRWGAPGFVAAFAAVDAVRYPRGAQVVLRTVRGLELGEVLAPVDDEAGAPVGGEILRGVTAQDELLQTRLLKNRAAAFEAWPRWASSSSTNRVRHGARSTCSPREAPRCWGWC